MYIVNDESELNRIPAADLVKFLEVENQLNDLHKRLDENDKVLAGLNALAEEQAAIRKRAAEDAEMVEEYNRTGKYPPAFFARQARERAL
jgi:hypothetical protein